MIDVDKLKLALVFPGQPLQKVWDSAAALQWVLPRHMCEQLGPMKELSHFLNVLQESKKSLGFRPSIPCISMTTARFVCELSY